MYYFRELPELDYQSPLSNRISSDEYIRAKNLFRRVKLRDDLKNVFTIFNKYEIPDGYRPELVAEELYGKQSLDWVVLITSGIVNVRDQWPLSNYHLYKYSEEKYGEYLNDIHHYETTTVKDSSSRVILPAGKIVDSSFTIPDPTDPTTTLNPVIGISNYEYETLKNEEKRLINVLKKEYLQQFLNDFRNIMVYDKSSQYQNDKLVRTENTRITLP
jgi:hypothetical protein